MISLLLLLAPAKLNVEAGYYTLSELAAVTGRQGVPLDVPASLRDDTYLINLKGVEASALASALVKTGRLSVVPNGLGWTVRRDVVDEQDDRFALDQYLKAVRDGVDKLYGNALRNIDRLAKMPQEERDRAVDMLTSAKSKDPVQNDSNSLVYLFFGNELPYIQMQQAMDLVNRKPRPLVGKMIRFRTDLTANPGILSPGLLPSQGDGNVPIGAGKSLSKTTPIDGVSKLAFDPSSGAIAIRNALLIREFDMVALVGPGRGAILHPAWQGPSAEQLFRDKVGAYKARITASDTVDNSNAANTKVNFSHSSMRLSEALLRISGKAGANLVAYVGPFGDRNILVEGDTSLASLVHAAMQSRFDKVTNDLSVAERVQPGLTGVQPNPNIPFSATVTDGIVVVSDERDYLDGLLAGPSGISHLLENASLKEEAPRVSDILEQVNTADIPHWRTSIFSTRYLNYCNPLSLLPFARTYAASPQLRDLIRNLKPDGRGSLPVQKLEPAALKALTAAISDVSSLDDAVEGLITDPIMITVETNMAALTAGEIRVQRNQNQYSFSIGAERCALWRSWISNVKPG